MSNKKRGLGRTLETLLAGNTTRNIYGNEVDKGAAEEPAAEVSAPAQTSQTSQTDTVLRNMSIDQLQRGQYQPRRDMDQDALQELAESIKAQGIVQPIVARKLASGNYEIIAGERRWRAAQLAELQEVPVVVKDLTDEEALAIGLIENIQRENLNPIEEAVAFQRLANEFSLTHQEIADAVGRSRVAVSNLLRLLTLTAEVKKLLENGDLEMGHARALLALNENQQSVAAKMVIERGLSVRETEALVRRMQAPTQDKAQAQELDPDTRQLQQRLSDTLGANVKIQPQAKGKGKLVIAYNSLDELDGILEHIN